MILRENFPKSMKKIVTTIFFSWNAFQTKKTQVIAPKENRFVTIRAEFPIKNSCGRIAIHWFSRYAETKCSWIPIATTKQCESIKRPQNMRFPAREGEYAISENPPIPQQFIQTQNPAYSPQLYSRRIWKFQRAQTRGFVEISAGNCVQLDWASVSNLFR